MEEVYKYKRQGESLDYGDMNEINYTEMRYFFCVYNE